MRTEPARLLETTEDLQLPPITWENIALGVVVLLVGWLASRVLGWLTRRILLWRGRSPSASTMFAALTRWLVLLLSFAAAITVIFPSVRPVNALGGIGVLSIAAGIAFQTVLGNMFAGIVILARDKFRVNDQIAVRDVAGTVTGISLTSTAVRTYDGRLVLIPNSVVHSEIVTVQTGYEQVRSTIRLDIDDSADLDLALRAAHDAMQALPAVAAEPPPQALLQEVGTATVRMDLRFWSGARQMETKLAQHEVIGAVLRGLSDAGVKTGSDVVVVEGGPQLLAAVGGGESS
ncbi:mechanosensitive ion channel family protein [Nocardioides gilvus]|uniref:mechanosensitive ion channel family protein n=1 Tax=Nocardioides gilvus TaxID=1735589 RepID=UPI001950450A|nr:mechanosensitive ion channel family protein [Nocardioides gilvus]